MTVERAEKQKQKLLRECWNKRNPAHYVDSNGVDWFWGTLLRVLEDYEDALMLPYVEKPFFCNNDKISIRCEKQCLGCYNLQEREESEHLPADTCRIESADRLSRQFEKDLIAERQEHVEGKLRKEILEKCPEEFKMTLVCYLDILNDPRLLPRFH